MPTLPKQDRPAREGARVASVETGLAAAAAKLAQQVSLTTEAICVWTVRHVQNVEEEYGSMKEKLLYFACDLGAAKAS